MVTLGDIWIDENGGVDATNTAETILFFDKLFDSLNSSSSEPNPNEYRCPVTEKSIHSKFWKEAQGKLMRMKFVNTDTLQPSSSVKTIKNWKLTIEGFEKLCEILKVEGFNSFQT